MITVYSKATGAASNQGAYSKTITVVPSGYNTDPDQSLTIASNSTAYNSGTKTATIAGYDSNNYEFAFVRAGANAQVFPYQASNAATFATALADAEQIKVYIRNKFSGKVTAITLTPTR